MEFQTDPFGDVGAVIRGEGRLNMVSGPLLRDAVKKAIDGGRPRIVVELSGVQFMDSSGLGALIGCLKSARESQGDLRIVAPSTQVSMVLKLSNVDKILSPYATIEEAFGD